MLRTQIIHLAQSLPVASPLRKELIRLAAKKPENFITDFGATTPFVIDGTEEKIDLPRYGVWGNKGHWSGKAEVLEVSDDLEALQRKYGPDLPVQKLR